MRVIKAAASGPLVLALLHFHLHREFTGSPLDYLVVAAAAAASWAGVPGPGEPVLIAAALLASRHRLDIGGVVIVAWVGATVGGVIGWAVGLKAGRALMTAPGTAAPRPAGHRTARRGDLRPLAGGGDPRDPGVGRRDPSGPQPHLSAHQRDLGGRVGGRDRARGLPDWAGDRRLRRRPGLRDRRRADPAGRGRGRARGAPPPGAPARREAAGTGQADGVPPPGRSLEQTKAPATGPSRPS